MKYLNDNNDIIDYWNFGEHQGLYVIEVTSKDGRKSIYVGKALKTDYTNVRKRLCTHNNNIRHHINGTLKKEDITNFYSVAAKGENIQVLGVKKTYHTKDGCLGIEEQALIEKFQSEGHHVLNMDNKKYFSSYYKGEVVIDEKKRRDADEFYDVIMSDKLIEP